MNPFIILIFFSLIACGGKSNRIDFGKTTTASLLEAKGDPLSEEAIPANNGKVLVYEKDEKFQVENDLVTNQFRQPVGDERNLLFWKHKFKDCDTSTKLLGGKPKGHESQEVELKCSKLGQSVIYAEGAQQILRVREYAKE
jgi:hypothetical protein